MPANKNIRMTMLPLPKEFGDLLYDIIHEAETRDGILDHKDEDGYRYSLILQPTYNTETKEYDKAMFSVVSSLVPPLINEVLLSGLDIDQVSELQLYGSKSGGIYIPNRDQETGVKTKKTIEDFEPAYVLIKPPVYIDGEDMTFTTEYEND